MMPDLPNVDIERDVEQFIVSIFLNLYFISFDAYRQYNF